MSWLQKIKDMTDKKPQPAPAPQTTENKGKKNGK